MYYKLASMRYWARETTVNDNSDFEKSYRAWHTGVSYMKSAVRILSCAIALYDSSVYILATGLLIAELLGIVEEWV